MKAAARNRFLSALLALGAWTPALAQAPAATGPGASAAAPSNQSGQQLATQGANGVAPCSSCHGAKGEGNPAAGFPRLAGQSSDYLARQLDSYADDSRRNAVMQPIAKAMTGDQRRAAAAYYAALSNGSPAAVGAAPSASAAPPLGVRLATIGDQGLGVQGCANCHGPQGVGEGPYPYLAGQHATYLRAALAEWKDGSRNNDPSGQMQRIAKALDESRVNAVVAYYAALPAPSTAAQGALTTAHAATRRIVSGPTQSAAAAGPGANQGIGSEQGSPVSGGSQGVGGPGNSNGPQSGAPGAASSVSR
jgi:cytochrome c553